MRTDPNAGDAADAPAGLWRSALAQHECACSSAHSACALLKSGLLF